MPSFGVDSVTDTTVRIYVVGATIGEYVHYFVRLASDSSDETVSERAEIVATTYFKTLPTPGSGKSLLPGTKYAINVGTCTSLISGPTTWWNTGDPVEFTTTGSSASRPSNWSWWNTIAQGAPIKISAPEWNNFCSRINDFREYAGLTSYGFTTVYTNDLISASVCSQAWYAINNIPGRGTMPGIALQGQPITEHYFNQLKNALNAIP